MYLPEFVNGSRVIVQVPRGFRVDNTELQANTTGLQYWKNPDPTDIYSAVQAFVDWGTILQGNLSDGWLEVVQTSPVPPPWKSTRQSTVAGSIITCIVIMLVTQFCCFIFCLRRRKDKKRDRENINEAGEETRETAQCLEEGEEPFDSKIKSLTLEEDAVPLEVDAQICLKYSRPTKTSAAKLHEADEIRSI